MYSIKIVLLATAVLVGSATGARADSLRCGKWVVSESATVTELQEKCGSPKSRDVSKEDAYFANPNGARVKSGVQTVTERWLYQPSPGALPMTVLIVDGKIVRITRAE